MSNITLVVDDKVLLEARKAALEQGTSLNALVREFLEQLAGAPEERAKAIEHLRKLWKQSRARVGRKKWSRDSLHER